MTEECSSIGLTKCIKGFGEKDRVTRSWTVRNQIGTQGIFAYNFIDTRR